MDGHGLKHLRIVIYGRFTTPLRLSYLMVCQMGFKVQISNNPCLPGHYVHIVKRGDRGDFYAYFGAMVFSFLLIPNKLQLLPTFKEEETRVFDKTVSLRGFFVFVFVF